MKSISQILLLLNPITFKNYSFRQQQWLVNTFKIVSEFLTHQPDKAPLLKKSSNYSSQPLGQASQNNSSRNEISPTWLGKELPKGTSTKGKEEDNVYRSLLSNSNQPIAGSSLWLKTSFSLHIVMLSLPSKPLSLWLSTHPTFSSATDSACDFERHLGPFVITIFAWEYLLRVTLSKALTYYSVLGFHLFK